MDKVELLGMVAAVLTTGAFIPQAVKVIKTKNTNDLSLTMYMCIVVGVALWLIYGYIIDSLPIMLANFVTLVLSGTILMLKIKYK